MKFNLKHYLTERFSSSIIVDKILNEPGGFFKIYQAFYNNPSYNTDKPIENHLFDKTYLLSNKLTNIIKKLFSERYDRNLGKYVYVLDNTYTDNNTYRKIELDDEHIIKAHNTYMKLWNEFINSCKKLFNKPSTEVLRFLLTYNHSSYSYTYANELKADLANITDNQFTKYTYTDLKNKRDIYDSLFKLDATMFFFNENNELLAVSKNDNITMIAPKIYLTKYTHSLIYKLDDIINNILNGNTDIFKLKEIETVLSNGETLIWPIQYHDYKSIMNIIKDKLAIQEMAHDYGKIGKFLGKASNLYKLTKWGESKNDYVYVYEYNNFIDYKTQKSYEYKQNINTYVNSRFRWVTDIFGNIYPYGGGTKSEKTENLYKFLKKFELYMFTNAYNADLYAVKMYQNNIQKYKALKQINTSISSLKNIEKSYNNIINNILQYLQVSKDVTEKIKTYKSTDSELQNLLTLFGAYSFTLNTVLSTVQQIKLGIQKVSYEKQNLLNKIINQKNIENYERNTLEGYLKQLNELIYDLEEKQLPGLTNAMEKLQELL